MKKTFILAGLLVIGSTNALAGLDVLRDYKSNSLNYVSIENDAKKLIDIDINGQVIKLSPGSSFGMPCNKNERVYFNAIEHKNNQVSTIEALCKSKILLMEDKNEN